MALIIAASALVICLQLGMTVLFLSVFNAADAHAHHQICWGKVIGDTLFTGLSGWLLNRSLLKWHKLIPLGWMLLTFFNDLNWEGGAAFGIR